MKKYRMRLFLYLSILVGIISLLTFSCYNTWKQVYSNRKNKRELEVKYNSLLEKENNLSDEVLKLQDPEYVAKYAREKFSYTKDGELIIDFTKNKENNV